MLRLLEGKNTIEMDSPAQEGDILRDPFQEDFQVGLRFGFKRLHASTAYAQPRQRRYLLWLLVDAAYISGTVVPSGTSKPRKVECQSGGSDSWL